MLPLTETLYKNDARGDFYVWQVLYKMFLRR